jgi:hypothetical protein
MKRFLAVALLALSSCQEPAWARWKPEYAQLSPSIQQWYKDAVMTPETKERLHTSFSGCCDEGDVVKDAEFKLVPGNTTTEDRWYYRRPGTQWKEIHPDTIHWGESAPDGKSTLFIYNASGQELCFYPAAGI